MFEGDIESRITELRSEKAYIMDALGGGTPMFDWFECNVRMAAIDEEIAHLEGMIREAV